MSDAARLAALPLAGLSVVEVAAGVSELGLGMAGGVPGMMLADLGATVTRVVGTTAPAIDAGVPWGRAWHRDKQLVTTDDPADVRARLAVADIALVYGPEALVEQCGLGWVDVQVSNPGLVYARCRPSRTGRGNVDDYGLLVEANAGLCSQLAGHRPGPIFVDVRATGAGAAGLLTASTLALLRRRALTGRGGWAETSLYDGMLATLGCMIGRSERAPAEVEGYWTHGSTFPNFLYHCADGELIQVWFGGKGMYAKLIEVLGDEPITEGYYQDQATGQLGVRAARWTSTFTTLPRDVWIERLRTAGVACEPVLGPGEALRDPHLTDIGLAIPRTEHGHDDVVLTTPISIGPLLADVAAGTDTGTDTPRSVTGMWGVGTTFRSQNERGSQKPGGTGLLAGVKVVDFSAFVAGPLAAQVLADLGADVIKVEPPGGEAMRGAAYAMAAGQRGKRGLAMDITAPEARPIVERLLTWADVVLHNFRVGVSERLGIDEATVARLNPQAVYCHASAFGPTGPRAKSPGNDALMQALTGFERAIGGAGNNPIAATWIPLDMSGGWVAAIGILAGLYATVAGGDGEQQPHGEPGHVAVGQGRQVATSLIGAGMLMHGGVFTRDGAIVRGPELDGDQTGYGPGYRIYRAGDGEWLALVVPDPDAWQCLRSEIASLPAAYTPIRTSPDDAVAREAEAALEAAFATASATEWVARLRAHGLPVELVTTPDRDGFRRGILDDPMNRQLGRVVAYETADWGHFEQIGPLLRCGPDADGGPPLSLPRVGEHSVAALTELGFAREEIDALVGAKVVRQL